jgi:hypothetical protein
MAAIDGFNDFFGLPYTPGKIWNPNFIKIIYEDDVCDIHMKTGIQIKKDVNGLVLWTLMYWHPTVLVISIDKIPEWFVKMMKGAIQVMSAQLARRMKVMGRLSVPILQAVRANTPITSGPNANSIRQTVGQSGVNRPEDVMQVQFLLNAAMQKAGTAPLKVDGKLGPKTLAALQRFRNGFMMQRDDVLVTPNGPTMEQLQDLWTQRVADKVKFPVMHHLG